MRPGVLLVVLAIVGVAGLAGPAQAAAPVFAAPQTLAAAARVRRWPSAPQGMRGCVGGRTSGVYVARRASWVARSAPPSVSETTSPMAGASVAPASALAWPGRPPRHSTAPSLRVAVAPLGARFDAPETVPLPAARGVSGTLRPPGDVNVPAVLLGADGSVTAAVGDVEHRCWPRCARRRTLREAQVLGTNARSVPVLAADGSARSPCCAGHTRRRALGPRDVVLAAERRPAPHSGLRTRSPIPRSAPARRVWRPTPAATCSRHGGLRHLRHGGLYFPVGADVAIARSAARGQRPHRVTAPARPSSSRSPRPLKDFAPAWWPPCPMGPRRRGLRLRAGRSAASPDLVHGRSDLGIPTTPSASTRSAGPCRDQHRGPDAAGSVQWSAPRGLDGRDLGFGHRRAYGRAALATDRFGNGLIACRAWDDQSGDIHAAPPFVSGLRVGRREFRFHSSEPAIITLSIREAIAARPRRRRWPDDGQPIRFSKRTRHP